LAVPAVQDAVRSAELELGNRGRILLRPSGTEPVVRVMVEGMDALQVQRIAEALADSVRAELGA
jgi:phosphoglucosamine mutase